MPQLFSTATWRLPVRRERLRAVLPRGPRPAPGPASHPALVHVHTKTRCGSAPSHGEPLSDSGRAAVQEHGGALPWASASRLTPASRAQPGSEDRSQWRLPPAAGLRGRPAARRAQAVRTGGVAAQAPSPPRVAPAPSRRRPAGFAAGATAGRSPTPRQVSGAAARAGGPAREARGGNTGVSWPLSAGRVPGMPVETRRRQGRVEAYPPDGPPAAPLPLPRPPKQLFTTECGRGCRTGGQRSFFP